MQAVLGRAPQLGQVAAFHYNEVRGYDQQNIMELPKRFSVTHLCDCAFI